MFILLFASYHDEVFQASLGQVADNLGHDKLALDARVVDGPAEMRHRAGAGRELGGVDARLGDKQITVARAC